MNMFRQELKANVKKEHVRKKVAYKSFKELIVVVIKIDDDWYELNLQKKFDKIWKRKSWTYSWRTNQVSRRQTHQKTISWRWDCVNEIEFHSKT